MDKKKLYTRLKKAGLISIWVLLVSGLVVCLAFVNHQVDEVRCSKINVRITPENELMFVDRETALRAIRADGNELLILGTKLSDLRTSALERKFLHNKMIRKATVFTDLNGVLNIRLQQREPIIRIIKPDGTGFYIDRNGLKMPLSERFTARVPVATGNIYERYNGQDSMRSFVCKELFRIATYVDKDAFWKAQIEQIFVNAENELVLIPKVGDHQVIFGDTQNTEEKFSRLMLFYKEGLGRMGWSKYKIINLSFNGQVVCVKRDKK